MGCRAKVSAIRTGLTRAQKTEHIKPDEGGATVWDITVLRVAAVAGSKKQFVVRAHRTGTEVILARADIETPVKQAKLPKQANPAKAAGGKPPAAAPALAPGGGTRLGASGHAKKRSRPVDKDGHAPFYDPKKSAWYYCLGKGLGGYGDAVWATHKEHAAAGRAKRAASGGTAVAAAEVQPTPVPVAAASPKLNPQVHAVGAAAAARSVAATLPADRTTAEAASTATTAEPLPLGSAEGGVETEGGGKRACSGNNLVRIKFGVFFSRQNVHALPLV